MSELKDPPPKKSKFREQLEKQYDVGFTNGLIVGLIILAAVGGISFAVGYYFGCS